MLSSVGVHTSRASLTPAVLTLQHPAIFSTTGNDIATAEITSDVAVPASRDAFDETLSSSARLFLINTNCKLLRPYRCTSMNNQAALWLARTRQVQCSVISNKKQTTDRLAMQPHMNRRKNIPRAATAGSAGIPWLKTLLTEIRERASTSTGAPTKLKVVGDTER
ncbi:hypothetical protein COCSADRAFT_158040 [Bipolaris sorokiniana ND90Pr]|uniref:Uncharacterized protein n=1 Tax=Cochliobolus sativus (strain ND90Pr / ATCC 201652) TaxID=665912 RepID=M2RM30_COCSN|nr:uncharacterized protein COCSADRAFT_158040 [Bipolaris sorokiniana ND90Pr]EMD67674.1 hypothetical protein COCSADRAFT_158040 [Bipolaris sorokiniana ND90Pr]